MSDAMKLAVVAGRKGYLSGMIEKSKKALKSPHLRGRFQIFKLYILFKFNKSFCNSFKKISALLNFCFSIKLKIFLTFGFCVF